MSTGEYYKHYEGGDDHNDHNDHHLSIDELESLPREKLLEVTWGLISSLPDNELLFAAKSLLGQTRLLSSLLSDESSTPSHHEHHEHHETHEHHEMECSPPSNESSKAQSDELVDSSEAVPTMPTMPMVPTVPMEEMTDAEGTKKPQRKRKRIRTTSSKMVDRVAALKSGKSNEVPMGGFYYKQWHKMFGELVQYKNKHGDTDVPKKYPEDQKLSNWVQKQRTEQLHGLLSSDRYILLKNLGFEWSKFPKERLHKTPDELWEDNFQKLLVFKVKFGHTKVTVLQDKKLCSFVNTQRKLYRERNNPNGKGFPNYRYQKLEQIGFLWDVHCTQSFETNGMSIEEAWEYRYRQLVAYKQTMKGKCIVPESDVRHRLLRIWCQKQRSYFSDEEKRKLHDEVLWMERRERLNLIKFSWAEETSDASDSVEGGDKASSVS